MTSAKEGNLYKSLKVAGTTFDIHYGYHSDMERDWWEPTPIYPDFLREPQFTSDGEPYTRADQDICRHYCPKASVSGEEWCNDCSHFQMGEDIIGVCKSKERHRSLRQNE